MPDEEALFGAGRGPRIFGEGDYASGGAANQGNYRERDKQPHGSRGSFDDAGGYGGTQLLGEERPVGGRARSTRRAGPRRPTKR